MSSTRPATNGQQDKDTPYDKCDYIPCRTNTLTESEERVRLKKCTGCGLTRYCSKECQRSDRATHKVWCKTHKASEDSEDQSDVRRELQRRIPRWRRAHLPALKEALLSSLDLPRSPSAHAVSALRLFLTYHPEKEMARCMNVERVARMSYAGAEEQSLRRRFAGSRRHYEEQFRAQNPRASYGAGLVVLTITHPGDLEGQTTYGIPVEITVAEAKDAPCLYWMELLSMRLHMGTHVDPAVDRTVRDTLLYAHSRNVNGARQNWDWDLETVDLENVELPPPPYTIDEMIQGPFMTSFEEQFNSAEQRAVIRKLDAYIDQLEHGTRQEHEEMGIYKVQSNTNGTAVTNIPNWQRFAAINSYCWLMACFLRRSKPTRIEEAEPYLRRIIEVHAPVSTYRLSEDSCLLFYLAVALSHVAGQEEEAFRVFNQAVPSSRERNFTDVWARANISRMLRRLGRVSEAEEQELLAVRWLVQHPLAGSPTVVRNAVRDDRDPHAKNYILEHPLVAQNLRNTTELPGNSPFSYTLMYSQGGQHVAVVCERPL